MARGREMHLRPAGGRVKNIDMRSWLAAALLLVSCKTQQTPPASAADATAHAQPAAQAPAATQAPATPPVKEIAITSKGFEPNEVKVAPGKPVVLRFTRKVAETCADAVEVQGDEVEHALPLNTPVDVKVNAPASGQLVFACPMRMYHGKIVVVAE